MVGDVRRRYPAAPSIETAQAASLRAPARRSRRVRPILLLDGWATLLNQGYPIPSGGTDVEACTERVFGLVPLPLTERNSSGCSSPARAALICGMTRPGGRSHSPRHSRPLTPDCSRAADRP